MCRLLLVKAKAGFSIAQHLENFAEIARNSREYQGHGWGCAYIRDGEWRVYRNISPVWEDDLRQFGSTTLLLAHARSAFKDEGIEVANNMPFDRGPVQFIFNGELRGVRIRETGRIGAEKLFNYIMRFHKGNLWAALEKAAGIIEKRTDYIRAMNIIMVDRQTVCVSSLFNEDADYFTLHFTEAGDTLIVCSAPYPGETGWRKIPNNTIRTFEI